MISARGDPREQLVQAHIKTKASIKSVPTEIVIMIIENVKFKDALKLCKALLIPEQVAVQYCAFEENIIYIAEYYFLEPISYKVLLKNKTLQIKADLYYKTRVALKTYDLDFLKNLKQIIADSVLSGARKFFLLYR